MGRAPADIHAASLVLTSSTSGDTVVRAGTLHVALSPLSLLMFHPVPGEVELIDARLSPPPRGGIESDSLDLALEPEETHG